MSRRELNTANLLPCPTPVPAGSVSSMSGVRLVFCPVYQQCLDVAVRNEDYELAAKLRDEIKKME